ncbi:MAG TPA: nuclear transport factor 2 family protein [Actinomycetota bacterium]|nr:nuclear transport factor 2 family protein [Actinomycetota bacterium]
MTRENVDSIRRGFEAWLQGDFDTMLGMIEPDVEWIAFEPGPWDCHGRDQMERVMRERFHHGARGRLAEVLDAGDKVVICVSDRTIGEALGLDVDRITTCSRSATARSFG